MSNPSNTKSLEAVLERMAMEGMFRVVTYRKDHKGYDHNHRGVNCLLKSGSDAHISYFFWAHTAETIDPEDAPKHLTLIAPVAGPSIAGYGLGQLLKVRTLFPYYHQQKREAPRNFSQFELLALRYHLENLLEGAQL